MRSIAVAAIWAVVGSLAVAILAGSDGSDAAPTPARSTNIAADADADALTLYGRSDWSGYAFEALLEFDGIESALPLRAVAARTSPFEQTAYTLDRSDGAWMQTVERVRPDGSAETLRREPLAPDVAEALTENRVPFRIELDRGVLRIRIGGASPVTVWVGTEARGRCGLRRAPGLRIVEAEMHPVGPPTPTASVNEIFDEEKLMAVWMSEWRPASGAVAGTFKTSYAHRSLFYGDTEVEAALPENAWSDETRRREVAVALKHPADGGTTDGGYTVRCVADPEGPPVLRLFRKGEEAAAASLDGRRPPRRIRVRAADEFVLVFVDDRAEIVYRDDAPLDGRAVAWACSASVPLRREDVTVFDRNLLSYTFNRAATDWRIGAGVWAVANRWECDPRWSFFAGMSADFANRRVALLKSKWSDAAQWTPEKIRYQLDMLPDSTDRHIVLWNKRPVSGDFSVEVFMGQMMNRRGKDGGSYPQYVQNFCVTVCADGENLDSGYSFIFGGGRKMDPKTGKLKDHNSVSMLTRRGVVVASEKAGIDTKKSHRWWHRLHLRRDGDTVICTGGRQSNKGYESKELTLVSLRFEDPDPIPSGQIAVWSYDCGILLPRVRIAAEEIGPPESPLGDRPARVGSFYRPVASADTASESGGDS